MPCACAVKPVKVIGTVVWCSGWMVLCLSVLLRSTVGVVQFLSALLRLCAMFSWPMSNNLLYMESWFADHVPFFFISFNFVFFRIVCMLFVCLMSFLIFVLPPLLFHYSFSFSSYLSSSTSMSRHWTKHSTLPHALHTSFSESIPWLYFTHSSHTHALCRCRPLFSSSCVLAW